ncbi:unnamed protein product, partial [Brassica oleracea]
MARTKPTKVKSLDSGIFSTYSLVPLLFVFHMNTNIILTGATVVIKFHTGYKSRSKWLKTVTHDLGEFESIFLPRSTQFPDLEKTFDVK